MNFARIENSALTEVQRIKHGDPANDPEREFIKSLLQRAVPTKMGWLTHMPSLFEGIPSDKGETVKYTLSLKSHRLLYSFMTQRLPALTVKAPYLKTVQIRWPRNVAHHIITAGTLMDGSRQVQSLNSTFLDFHRETFQQKNARTEWALGNRRSLTEWRTALPEAHVAARHPWFYAQATDASIPIEYDHQEGPLLHEYKVRSNIADLLEMRRFNPKTKTWVVIKPVLEFLRGIPDGAGKMDTPKLWGELGNRSELETAMLRRKADGALPDLTFEYVDMVYEEANAVVLPGGKAEFAIMPQWPCEGILFGAQQVHPKGLPLFSNYSTSTRDEWWLDDEAENPVRSMDLSYGTQKRTLEYPSIALESINPEVHFPFGPDAVGINAFAFAEKMGRNAERQTGMPLHALIARLTIALGSAESKYLPDEKEEESPMDTEEEGGGEGEPSGNEAPSGKKGKGAGAGKKTRSGGTYGAPSSVAASFDPDDMPVSPSLPYRVFCMFLVQRHITYSFDTQQQKYIVTVDEPSTLKSARSMASSLGMAAPTPMVPPLRPALPAQSTPARAPIAAQPAFYQTTNPIPAATPLPPAAARPPQAPAATARPPPARPAH